MPDLISLTPDPLDAARAIAFVTDGHAGAIDVFLGTTRHDTDATGRTLIALDYEAYPDMAVTQMRDIATRARQHWPVLKVALLHRVGRVAVGEPSVIIAVSTPHRADSFAVCKFIIDTLKKEVTVWKKEIWTEGEGTWVHPIENTKIEDRG